MPVLNRKRRAVEEDAENDGVPAVDSQPPRKRLSRSPESDAYEDPDAPTRGNGTSTQQLVKKLVRYALACEYARQPIKRQDITTKVLDTESRQFKAVFAEAQMTLRDTFGMEMAELPLKEKVTIRERRAAQSSDKQPSSSKQWMLVSVLDPKYRDATILQPSQAPTTETESAYIGLYTMIISVIHLAGGTLPEAKLERYLRRMNADRSTPVDKTDKLLARLVREGYIVRLRDNTSGEEVIEYMVGPRGKVEIGQEGVADLVRKVYGQDAPGDLERRLERSLGLSQRREETTNGAAGNGEPAARRPGRPRRKTRDEELEDEQEDEESSDEG